MIPAAYHRVLISLHKIFTRNINLRRKHPNLVFNLASIHTLVSKFRQVKTLTINTLVQDNYFNLYIKNNYNNYDFL